MDERRLVPSVRDVILRAGCEAALDPLAETEVLGIDGVQRQLHVRRPVLARLVRRRRLGNVEQRLEAPWL